LEQMASLLDEDVGRCERVYAGSVELTHLSTRKHLHLAGCACCEMEFQSALRLRGINVEDVGRIRRACTKLESVLAPRAKTIAEAVYVVNGEIRKTIRDQEIEIGLTAQSAIRNRMRSEGDTLEKRV